MLNILHFYKTYYPYSYGGVERVIFHLCEGLIEYGINSTVFTLSPRNNNCDSRLIGHHYAFYSAIDFKCASTPFSFRAIKRFFELAENADIIHFHFPYPFMDILHLLSINTKPTLVSYHSDIVKQKFFLKLYTPIMHCFLSSVNYIIASSPNYVATSSILQRYISKVLVIPFGLDRNYYPLLDKRREDKWKMMFGKRFFLFIGVFRYYKGLHTLITAASYVSYPIVLVGIGPIELELKKYASKLALKNIHFLGALSEEDKVALLNSCYSIVFPSHLRSESFGITLLEGAMYGKPFISCEIGTGTTYINIHQKTGLVISPDSPIELANAMRQLWLDPIKTSYYGEQALKRFNSLFTSSRMVSSYVNIYNKIV